MLHVRVVFTCATQFLTFVTVIRQRRTKKFHLVVTGRLHAHFNVQKPASGHWLARLADIVRGIGHHCCPSNLLLFCAATSIDDTSRRPQLGIVITWRQVRDGAP